MEKPQHTLVVGATGLLGGEIVQQLRSAEVTTRALVRGSADPAKRAAAAATGAHIAPGDLKDRQSLTALCADVHTVVSTASSTLSRQDGDTIQTVDAEGQLALVEAAEAAGVQRFVFVSVPEVAVDYALLRAKRAVEDRLRRSRMEWTILRPLNFTEAWLSPMLGFAPAQGTARVLGSGDKPVSWVSYRDVARFAVKATEGGAFSNAVVTLGGPDALGYLDVIHIFEELGCPKVTIEHVPESALEAQLAQAQTPLEEAFAAIMLSTARGLVADPGPSLELLPGKLVSVREYATRVLSETQREGGSANG